MSRIGKKPILIPGGTQVTLEGTTVKVKGPKGELKFTPHTNVTVKIDGQTMTIAPIDQTPLSRGLHGMTRTMLSNMIEGVNKGFAKKLIVEGVGFRIQLQGKKLNLNLGYSHPIDFLIPEGITITIDQEKKNTLTVTGTDKGLVGQVSADIRELRPPEPYKGKGIRYENEVIVRKAGKTAASASSGGAK